MQQRATNANENRVKQSVAAAQRWQISHVHAYTFSCFHKGVPADIFPADFAYMLQADVDEVEWIVWTVVQQTDDYALPQTKKPETSYDALSLLNWLKVAGLYYLRQKVMFLLLCVYLRQRDNWKMWMNFDEMF